MTKNYLKSGNTIPIALCPYARASGEGVKMGTAFGVTTHAAAINTPVEVETVGVHTLAKLTGTAWTDGALLAWDDTNKWCTPTISTHLVIGYAVGAAASAAATGDVRLSGCPRVVGA